MNTLYLVLFLAAIAAAPWAARRYAARRGLPQLQSGGGVRVIDSTAIGGQQRLVTVEAGPPGARVHLLLGVGPGTIRTLHASPAAARAGASARAKPAVMTPPGAPVASPANVARTVEAARPPQAARVAHAPGRPGFAEHFAKFRDTVDQ